jgi:hypothetical protein
MRHLAPATALALFPIPGGGGRSKQVPGSERAYTQAQIDDAFNPPDWFPDEHRTMPPIVAQGEKDP